MKLKNIINLGRYKNLKTSQEYNVKKGTRVDRSIDIIFYLFRNKRIIISDSDFYNSKIHTKIDI
jgi:hypothetical protein